VRGTAIIALIDATAMGVALLVLQVWTAEDPRIEDLSPRPSTAGSEPT
jgi:hypothetical protein